MAPQIDDEHIQAVKTDAQDTRICQGDIYSGVEFIEHISEKGDGIAISKIVFPYVIVLTQDCDLAQSSDKLVSVLVAPLYNAEHVYLGDHLSQIKGKVEEITKNKTPGKFLRRNDVPRYHYLKFEPRLQMVDSVIDFKHYFSVTVDYLNNIREEKFVTKISALYREDISQRFAAFLSRIGLPVLYKHKSELLTEEAK